MYLAYNTNGLAHHRLEDAVRLLHELGYQGVALTPDVQHLDLLRTDREEWSRVARLLRALDLRCVVETGARYVLDPRRKHWPSLVTRDEDAANRRIDFYRRACQLASALGAETVSLWSGVLENDVTTEEGFTLLLRRLQKVLDFAKQYQVQIAFEPEPGMLVGDLASYRRLRTELKREDLFTTLDTGHLLATEPGNPEQYFAEFSDHLRNVQVDDARRGVHEHLPIGQGELDFAAVVAELKRLDYDGPFALELSRDSHRAAVVAEQSIKALEPLLRAGGEEA